MDTEALDHELGEGQVSQEALRQLLDAEIYDAATTMAWLEKRLRILYQVADSGRTIEVHTTAETLLLKDVPEFDRWCRQLFSEAHACFFQEKPSDARPWFLRPPYYEDFEPPHTS